MLLFFIIALFRFRSSASLRGRHSSPRSPENHASVSLPRLHTKLPRSLSRRPVRVCFKSSKNLRLSWLTLSEFLSITVSFVADAVLGRMLDVPVGDWACVWNGDQNVADESIVRTG